MSKELALATQSTSDSVGFVSMNLDQKLEYCKTLVASRVIPSKSPEEALVIIQKGLELGFPPMASFGNIYVVQNRPTLSYSACGALILAKGHYYFLSKDFEPVYNEKKEVIDYVTEFTFMRIFRFNGKGEKMTNKYAFTWTDAVKMGLSTRDGWQKQPKVMLRARALAGGARLFFPDVFLGTMYLADELDDTGKITYDEEGEITVIN